MTVKYSDLRSGLAAIAVAAFMSGASSNSFAAPPANSKAPAAGIETLGHSEGADLETKRIETTGEGMPSVKGPFPDTLNMTFLGQLTNADMGLEKLVFSGSSFLSDIWGWTSAGGDEFALVGTTSGVAFVCITDPATPVFLGIVPTTNAGTTRNFWWDIKVYNDHAYWTTEVNNAGVGIMDMNSLNCASEVPPGTYIPATARWGVDAGNGDDSGYIRAHNIAINPSVARAYLIGASKVNPNPELPPVFGDDGIIILDLTDPLHPVEVGTIDDPDPVDPDIDAHDAQIVTYAGPDDDHFGKELLVNFNGGELNAQIWDVSNPAAAVKISEFSYDGASFTHQGWFTEDHEWILLGDEEDELFGLQDPNDPALPDTARTHICDARDLDAVVCTNFFDSPAASIDHNLYVKGDRVYQAHYTAGIRVLDIDRPDAATLNLSEAGHMDTEPRLPNHNLNFNFNIFVGPWGVYPFFDSGVIAASDGLNGLVLMSLNP